MHPDLANTLNNLGVVYERLERPGRRALLPAGVRDRERGARSQPSVRHAQRNEPSRLLPARGIPFDRPLTTPPAPVSAARGSPHAAAGGRRQ